MWQDYEREMQDMGQADELVQRLEVMQQSQEAQSLNRGIGF